MSSSSFLKLPINYSIVTNIDYEHLIITKFLKFENFIEFINKTPPTGKAIVCMTIIMLKKF